MQEHIVNVACLLNFGVAFNLMDCSFKDYHRRLKLPLWFIEHTSFETDTTKVVEETDQSLWILLLTHVKFWYIKAFVIHRSTLISDDVNLSTSHVVKLGET